MPVAIRGTSRLKFSRLLDIDGVESWELPEYPVIESAPDDRRYRVERGDRIDRLASRFYQSTELWWVIAVANNMVLLPNDLKPGTSIVIPSHRRVFTDILRRPGRGAEGR